LFPFLYRSQLLEFKGFKIKVGPDGHVDLLKARLVAKDDIQVFGLDYGDTFSPVSTMVFARLFSSMVVIFHWPLHQHDINHVFFNSDLGEEVYMEQPNVLFSQTDSLELVCNL